MLLKQKYYTNIADALDQVADATGGEVLTVAPVVRLDTGEPQGWFVTHDPLPGATSTHSQEGVSIVHALVLADGSAAVQFTVQPRGWVEARML